MSRHSQGISALGLCSNRGFRAITLASCFLATGCSTSVEVNNFKPAQGPQGVHIELKLNGDVIDGDKVAGELLAVREDGLILSAEKYAASARKTNTIVLIPYWMMNHAKLDQMGGSKIESHGKEQNAAYLEKLRLVARFPQGLSDELLAALLRAMQQEKLETPHRTE